MTRQQLQYDLDLQTNVYEVRCRVEGELQGYQIEAKDEDEARHIMRRELPSAKPVLILVQNKEKNGQVSSDDNG